LNFGLDYLRTEKSNSFARAPPRTNIGEEFKGIVVFGRAMTTFRQTCIAVLRRKGDPEQSNQNDFR
jgi:hypothetical protein